MTSSQQRLTTCISIPDVIASLFVAFRLNMENQKDLKRFIEKNVLKDVGVSKKFFEYEFDKVHRIAAADGDKQNVMVRFRSHQVPSELYYERKKIKNKKIGLKPSLTKKKNSIFT